MLIYFGGCMFAMCFLLTPYFFAKLGTALVKFINCGLKSGLFISLRNIGNNTIKRALENKEHNGSFQVFHSSNNTDS